MKLKTNNAAKNLANTKKTKSPKKVAKGVEVRKDKSKVVVKPSVLKDEAEKIKVEVPLSPHKLLQKDLWSKAIENVSTMSNLSDEESSIVKLLSDYKKKSSIPQKKLKLKNFITKGFSKYKETSDEVLDGVFDKLYNEFKSLGGTDSTEKSKSKKQDSDKEMIVESNENDDDDDNEDNEENNDDEENGNDDDDDDDETEGIMFDDDDDDDGDDIEDESEEEKPKPKGKGPNKANIKNGKNPSNKGKNASKFKGSKVQKNKKNFVKKN